MKIQEYKKQIGSFYFFCPGCNEFHTVHTVNSTGNHRDGLKFELQGDKNNPTFVPLNQVIERTIEPFNKSVHANMPSWTCLSLIRSGFIRFLANSTHRLAGQSIELPELTAEQI